MSTESRRVFMRSFVATGLVLAAEAVFGASPPDLAGVGDDALAEAETEGEVLQVVGRCQHHCVSDPIVLECDRDLFDDVIGDTGLTRALHSEGAVLSHTWSAPASRRFCS